MSEFYKALQVELESNWSNQYGVENFDQDRFGKLYKNEFFGFINHFKSQIKRLIGFGSSSISRRRYSRQLEESLVHYGAYIEELGWLYDHFDVNSKSLLVKIIAFRILGFTRVRLPRNTKTYWDAKKKARQLRVVGETYDPKFMHFILNKYDLRSIGFDIRLFFSDAALAIDFILEQYSYKPNGRQLIGVERGDVVFDIGACWGDTALYFAAKTGDGGRVYSFEFVPSNLNLFEINLSLNPVLRQKIELVPHPVSDRNGSQVFFNDFGPGSRIDANIFEGSTGSITTITLDEFVKSNSIDRVDFIKMDIEGAEQKALQGAIETIKRFRPKLAIAIYHSMSDFVEIPKWILSLNLGYDVFIDHYTIHSEETICFAQAKKI